MLFIHENFNSFYSDATRAENQLILYGAGINGAYYGRAFNEMGYDFACYWDIDPNLHGMMLNSKPISNPFIHNTVIKDIPCYIFMTIGTKELILSALLDIERFGLRAHVFIPKKPNINYMVADARAKKLITHDFTIISNTCLAGILYKSFGCKTLSPTVNMIIEPKDFVKFCSDFDRYMSYELTYSHDEWKPATKEKYPVTRLNDMRIHMVHYRSYEEAKDAWDRRKERIVWDNLLFIFHDWHFLLKKDEIDAFLRIKHRNKLCLLSKSFYNFESGDPIVFLKEDSLLASYPLRLIEDHFDFVTWINNSVV